MPGEFLLFLHNILKKVWGYSALHCITAPAHRRIALRWVDVGMVLGEAFVKADGNGTPFAPGSWQDDIYEDRQVLRFVSPHQLSAADFRSVYEA